MLDKTLRICSLLFLFFAVAFILAPVLLVIYIAFLPQIGVLDPSPGFTLEWFTKFLSDPVFASAVTVTVELAIIVGAVSISISLLTGYVLTHFEFRGRGLIDSILIAPSAVPGVVKGMGLLLLFSLIGLQNSFDQLILGQVMISLPFGIISIVPSYISVDKSLERAARTLGATELQTFTGVVLPLIKPGILACAIFVISISVTDAATTVFLANAQTTPLAILLLSWTSVTPGNEFAAISTLLVAATVVVVLAVEKFVGLEKLVGGLYQ